MIIDQLLDRFPVPVLIIAAIFVVSLVAFAYTLLGPRRQQLALHRRRPEIEPAGSVLARAAAGITSAVDRVLLRRGGGMAGAELLEQAGVAMRLQEFTALLIIATLIGGLVGTALGGLLPGLLLAVLVPVGARIMLGLRVQRRQRAFADQLEDSLQLLASSLRAGHSMLQALNSVAREAEAPTSEEFARIINQTRIGREVGDALEDTASRMRSDDFSWVTQAIAINREVGGNLAEVLDAVGATIRERNQIRRQVKSLSAEGKMSAYVLMALPVGITAFLLVSNPSYILAFTSGLVGYAMITASVVLMVIGALWLRKIVRIKF